MFLIIIVIIIAIMAVIASNQPDKKNKEKVEEEISKLPKIYLKSRTLTGFEKAMNLAYDDTCILDSFLYEQGTVKLTMKNGKVLWFPLSEAEVRFEKDKIRGIFVTVKHCRGKVKFNEITNFNNQEWEVIYKVLSLAGTTYGTDIFSNWNKNLSKINSILKIIKALQ